MAGRKPARFFGRDSFRSCAGEVDLLVLRHHCYLLFSLRTGRAWILPFVGTVGWYVTQADGTTVFLSRGSAASTRTLNMTPGRAALVFFVCWIYWALQSNGPIGFLKHLFAPKGETAGAMKVLMVVVFFAVGFLEIFSILFRPISLSFRLYGNIFAVVKTCWRLRSTWCRVSVAVAGAVLFHGIAGGSCSGPGVHVVDGGVHAADHAS